MTLFSKSVIDNEMCVLIFSTTLKNFSFEEELSDI